MRILPKKRSQGTFPAAFLISADVKGDRSVFGAASEDKSVLRHLPTRPWAPMETLQLFFSSSLFSLRRTCAHVVAQTRTAPKRRDAAPFLAGAMMKGNSRRKGAERGVFLLLLLLNLLHLEEDGQHFASTCLLPFLILLPLLLFFSFCFSSAKGPTPRRPSLSSPRSLVGASSREFRFSELRMLLETPPSRVFPSSEGTTRASNDTPRTTPVQREGGGGDFWFGFLEFFLMVERGGGEGRTPPSFFLPPARRFGPFLSPLKKK